MEPHESLLFIPDNHEAEARHLIQDEIAHIPVPGLVGDEEPPLRENGTTF
jgi:hypothetical protein